MSSSSPMLEILSACPLCGSERFKLYRKPDLCKCSDCKLIFRSPRPSQQLILDCYDKGATFQQWQNELDIRALLWKKRLSLVSSYRRSGHLLDIGTGDGYFLNFAKEIYQIDATEVSEFGVRQAASWGHDVHHGTIFDKEFNNKTYDLITMWHVLEHLPEPGRFLTRTLDLLDPEGFLFVAVPNECTSLYSPLALLRKKHPFGKLKCDQEIHLTHFTPRVLTNTLINRYGLDVLKFDVDDVHLHKRMTKLPVMVVNKILSKFFRFHFDAAMVIVCSKSKGNHSNQREA